MQVAAKFERLWLENSTGELVPNAFWNFPDGAAAFAQYRQRYIRQLLQDTAGLGAYESLRRMMGIVSVWDISSIRDNQSRAVAERFVIRVSSRWIIERSSFHSIDDLVGILREEADSVRLD